jgi:hypothetical protein
MMQSPSPSEALERALETIDSLVDFLHFPVELARVDIDASAAAAGKMLVRRLSNALARNADFGFFEHGSTPG